MNNKKIIKLAEKKLKKSTKWLKKFGDIDMGHLDGTYDNVNQTRKLCKKILKVEKMRKS